MADFQSRSAIGLGLCRSYSSLDTMPGWESSSWGYHGDDGFAYQSGGGTSYGEKFGTGDTIGCQFSVDTGISFTKNGAPLGKY